jgi:RimJ/RimL family protein N-acetyltransferase
MKNFEAYLETIQKIAKEEGYDSLDETYVERLRARFFGEDVIIGKTKRLLLREMKLSDLNVFYSFEDAKSEEVLGAFLKETKEISEENLRAYISHMYPMYDYGMWTVQLLNTEEIVGICGLGHANVNGEMCTDLGYYICPKRRNQGLASECIEFMLDYAKNYLEFEWICAIIKEENRISKGILRKFGFSYRETCEGIEGKKSVYEKDLKEQQ